MTETTTTSTSGPITIDDVRSALSTVGGDPFATNAGALQRIIGRGSNATVQKCLEQIRAEVRPVVEIAPGTIPKPPADAIDAMWSAAWSAAQVHTLSRLEKVTSEREQLAGALAQLTQDHAGQGRIIDELTSTAAAAASEAAAALAAVQAEREQLSADFVKAQSDAAAAALAAAMAIEHVKTDFERLKAEGEARVALMTRDAQIAAQTMQGTIDELNRQIHARDMLLAQVHAPAPQGDQK